MPDRRRLPTWMIVSLVAFLVYSVNLRGDPRYDGFAAVPTAVSIVHDGNLTLDEYRDVPGFAEHYSISTDDDGRLVGFFPWAVALVAVPAVVAADVAHAVGIGPGADGAVAAMARWFAVLQNLTAAAATALAVGGAYVLVRRRRPAAGGRYVAVATFAFAFGTPVWSTAAVMLWQHGPSLAATTWGLVALSRALDAGGPAGATAAGRSFVRAGALFMAAYTFRPTNALVLLGAAVVVAVVARRGLARFAAGAALVAVPWCAVTYAAYGRLLQPYGAASRLGVHDEFAEALAANLISPGRGLFVFTPLALMSVIGAARLVRSRGRDPLMWLAAIVVPVHWVAVSMFGQWYGGKSYGPRFFTDVLPLLFLLAITVGGDGELTRASLRRPAVAGFALLLAAGVVVHAEGALVLSSGCWSSHPQPIEADPSHVWSWSDALVTKGVRDLVHDPVGAVRGVCRGE